MPRARSEKPVGWVNQDGDKILMIIIWDKHPGTKSGTAAIGRLAAYVVPFLIGVSSSIVPKGSDS